MSDTEKHIEEQAVSVVVQTKIKKLQRNLELSRATIAMAEDRVEQLQRELNKAINDQAATLTRKFEMTEERDKLHKAIEAALRIPTTDPIWQLREIKKILRKAIT